MCGITGIISNEKQPVSQETIRRATGCLQHRGPDGEGIWVNEEHSVALGHRRLAIIDLSPEASQPMHYLNRYVLVFNGELYNYIEIRTELEKKGFSFTTRSDTEVVLASYHAFGSDCLQKFDGMFAFAIWDRQEKILFAARDRFGEKPFFYCYDESTLTFGSEMKSLWKLGIKKEVNSAMLYNFLTIDYTGNPGDPSETFYTNIQKLPPASFLVYKAGTNQLTINKYWQIFTEPDLSLSEQQAIEKFRHLFSASIQKRLRSDVSIGTSLSGGLDSSAIVAFCEKESSETYTHKCFTASFPGYEKDETSYAGEVARKFNLEHYQVTISEEEVVSLMEKVMAHQEEPIASASPLGQYKVFEEAKKRNVTVLLDGQGADEVLAGYTKYYKWYWQELYHKGKLRKSRELQSARLLGVPEKFGLKNKAAALFPDLAAALLQRQKERHAKNHKGLNEDFAYENRQNLFYTLPLVPDLNGALYFNTFIYGLEELLRIADRNSMANGTEVRLPFLHHELVAFLFTLPSHFKIHEGWTKWLLRKSADEMLPKDITWRRNKTGFEPPQKTWMQHPVVQDDIRQSKRLLADHKILNALEVNKKIQPHDAHVADNWDWKCWSASFLFRNA